MPEPSLRPGTPVIFDIGLHHGDDTDFYLRKGFDVVAVEANPQHVVKARARFAEAIAQGRLEIIDAAIARQAGSIEFYVNLDKDDWSSTDPVYGARDGTRHEKITVPAVTFASLYGRFAGRVHYVKCDIEGGDIHVIEGLRECGPLPKYFSVEAHKADYLAFMRALGYTQFKLVNQNLNWLQKCPNPPREGVYIPDHVFKGDCSGPFGEEAPGKWLAFEECAELYFSLRNALRSHPDVIRGWFDFHGKLGGDAATAS
jgi:FkbM family methyltransferase